MWLALDNIVEEMLNMTYVWRRGKRDLKSKNEN